MTENTRHDRFLDQVADEIRDQRLDDDTVAAATDRVWNAIRAEVGVDAPLRSCADVQALLPAFVAGELPEGRALLVGDHTRGCVPCRRALLELKRGVAPAAPPAAPVGSIRRIPGWLRLAATILVAVGVGTVAVIAGQNLLAERSLTAQIASVDGTLQLVSDREISDLVPGDTVRARQRLRTAKDTGAFVRLADGSMIEMAPRSELELRASRRGTTIGLGRGNIIVHAADQGRGRLAVTTGDCEVAVKGTIFAVNHGLKGSRVSVIEGEVEVRHGSREELLLPGEQVTTDDRIATSAITDEIAWSRNADEYRQLLAELTRLQIDVAEAVDVGAPRTSTRLLDLAPEDTVLYIAMPNLTEGLAAARTLFSSRLAESEVLRDWWQREVVARKIDVEIEASLDRLQFIGDAVGDEVVVALGASGLTTRPAPVVLAEIEDPAAFRAAIEEHVTGHVVGAPPMQLLDDPDEPVADGVEVVIWVSDDLAVAAPTAAPIRAIAARLAGAAPAGFAGTELHQRLAERYARGVEWVLGLDLHRLLVSTAAATGAAEADLMDRLGLDDATTVVVERHRSAVGSDLSAEVRFAGARHGVASWLAAPAPMASLDFVSPDAYLVSSVAAKDGVELFDELLGMVAAAGPDALTELSSFEDEVGIDLRLDLAAAIGGEGTFAVDGPVVPVPTWKLILEVYQPDTLRNAFDRVIARANAELDANGAAPISVEVETVGGRTLTTVAHPSSPLSVCYTMADGYLVAGSSRWAVEQAIAVRDSGMGLARSPVFRDLLPDNGFTDCSALVYRNLAPIVGALPDAAMGGRLGDVESLVKDSAAPGLFCAYGLDDRILVAGTGPSLVGLAPLLGMGNMMAIDRVVGGEADALSSPE